jgi:diguanylate cyclase (GGDEF)-like protein/putative nucleotidyltransferase with HDIG domain
MKDLSTKAKAFILITIIAGGLAAALQLASLEWVSVSVLLLAILAATAQVLKVEGATHVSSYNISWLIYGFTLIYVGAPAALAVILLAHLIEWLWHRYPWYIQCFNIGNFLLGLTVSAQIYYLVNKIEISNLGALSPFLIHALAILLATASFTFINHLLVGLVLKFARGQNFSQSGVFGTLTLMIDFSMIGMGAATALIFEVNPFATVLSALPLYLIYSTLKVPALQRQTEIDPKTKLFNARYFAEALENELTRAKRFDRPLTLVMADLDLLRNINNTYGHLAGDVVLIGMANILQKHARDFDVVARFGGEEFAILMPETTPAEAYVLVESMRSGIESTEFEVSTSITPIKATMSFGLTDNNESDMTLTEIIHNADAALYHSKLSGRNQTSIFAENSVDGLFGDLKIYKEKLDERNLAARIDLSQQRFRPNPIREQKFQEDVKKEEKHGPAPSKRITVPLRRPSPSWKINAFIVSLIVGAAGLIYYLFQFQLEVDWLALAFFTLIIVVTEAFSIEIYVKENSISTAAIPLISGALLFGPTGALTLGSALAITSMIKNKSPVKRFSFNISNHVICSGLSAGLVLFTGGLLTELTIPIQFGLSVGGALICYLASTILLSIVISMNTGQPFKRIWSEQFRWLWPYYLAYGAVAYAIVLGFTQIHIFGVFVILVPIFLVRFSQAQYIGHTKGVVTKLRKKNVELETQSREISTLNEDLLLALSHVVDLRDPFVYGHSQHVTRYSVKVAEELNLPEERIDLIRKASLLHDIGKLGVSENILFKPGSLTAEEYEAVKQHTVLGAEIIDSVHSLRPLTPIVRHHHERYDGRGYPDGLKGQDIPLEARIICLSDSLEAMASDRPYRKALQFEEILQELHDNAGTQFDPAVVDAFLKVLEKEGNNFILNSAQFVKAKEPVLVEINKHHDLIPVRKRVHSS